jgi:hypothetical protein
MQVGPAARVIGSAPTASSLASPRSRVNRAATKGKIYGRTRPSHLSRAPGNPLPAPPGIGTERT